ncbi:hypothetical protein JB92DRAFT_3096522 [Gautieria morchelliformis]|nr:hypothetical protein JB92DRAFT_3096522 [Gautieria morchelliformis]
MNIEVEGTIVLPSGDAPARYGTLAALSILVYDYGQSFTVIGIEPFDDTIPIALTFDDEIALVWKRRWSFGKALFIFNRYFGLLSLLSYAIAFFFPDPIRVCRKFTSWTITSEGIAILAAECVTYLSWKYLRALMALRLGILIIRIYAVYDRSRRLLLLLIALLMAEVASSVVLVIFNLSQVSFMTMQGSTACQSAASPPLAFTCWIPPIIFETFLMSLMLNKGWCVYRSEGGSKLLHLIIRDNILYFGVMFLALLANCIVFANPSSDNRITAGFMLYYSFVVAIPCTLGSRLLLNIRERFFEEAQAIWTFKEPLHFASFKTSTQLDACPGLAFSPSGLSG